MRILKPGRSRTVLLLAFYLLGVLGIVASNGGGDYDYSSNCDIEVSGIASATDRPGDIWIGVTTRTSREAVHGVLRLADDGSTLAGYTFDDKTYENLVATIAVAVDALNAGDVYVGGDFDNRILRLNSDGTRDSGFAVGSGFDGRVNSIVPANDGSGDIYVGGDFSNYDGSLVSGLVRLNSDGSRDIGFIATPASNVESVALATDAPFLGYVYSGGRTAPTAVRWANNGIFDINFKPAIAEVFAVAAASDGSGDVYAGGNTATGVVRFNDDGSNDAGFDGSGFDARIGSIMLAGDMTGDIYVAGGFTSYDGKSANGIVRLADDGTRRISFDIGQGFTDETGSPAPVTSIARAVGGSDIYAGGNFWFYDQAPSKGIARLKEDGSLDRAFSIELPEGGDFCRPEAYFIFG